MLSQAATVALRILLFRAGPQDFPHAPQLVVPLPVIATLTYFAASMLLMPVGASLVIALASVGALALVTHSLLSARRMVNRFQQTFHALLATGVVLTLASLPALSALAPALKQMAANPELMKQPGAIEIPTGATLAWYGLNFWNLAVYGHIFRHATETRLAIGLLIALFAGLSVLMLSTLAVQLLMPQAGS